LSLKHLHIRNNGILREIISNDFHIFKEHRSFLNSQKRTFHLP